MKESSCMFLSCPTMKSISNKMGCVLFCCNSKNKYKRLDAMVEKKLVEVKRAASAGASIRTINSMIMRFPLFEEEVRKTRQVFEQCDKDGRGKINSEELKECLQSLHLHLTDIEIQDLLHLCDMDAKERLEFNEFFLLLCLFRLQMDDSGSITTLKLGSPQLETTIDTIVEAFLFLDTNGDGKLNKKDMVKALSDAPWEKSSAHITRTRFKEMDKDRNGEVSFREFVFAFINWIGVDSDNEVPVTGG